MGRKVKQLKNYTVDQIESLLRSDSNYIIGVKLHAIIQLGRGYSSRKLSEFYRTSFKQINNWYNRFEAEGIEGLRIKPGRGRHPFLTEEQTNQLRCDLNKTPQEFGYNTAVWTGPIMRKHINNVYHVMYKQAAVYKLMRRLGFKK